MKGILSELAVKEFSSKSVTAATTHAVGWYDEQGYGLPGVLLLLYNEAEGKKSIRVVFDALDGDLTGKFKENHRLNEERALLQAEVATLKEVAKLENELKANLEAAVKAIGAEAETLRAEVNALRVKKAELEAGQ